VDVPEAVLDVVDEGDELVVQAHLADVVMRVVMRDRHPHGPELGVGAVLEVVRVHTAAGGGTGLDDLDRVAELQQLVRGHEAGHAGAEDDHVPGAGVLAADLLENCVDRHMRIRIVDRMFGAGRIAAHERASVGRRAMASIATSAPGAGSAVWMIERTGYGCENRFAYTPFMAEKSERFAR
jgi:hypothetical protein